ncbi:Asp-tRNA(Asn)/Glu-tRNA(Gln) amidotransferase subunit GatC [Mycoplasmopsis primatum]|uniref:Asp-tRNA(Asn)/Glu-tRNA(Gln) amidotransferase subunit GatC n=1 Tax=Mycoplasmopsis primatum TaxID=55604 RepID=UPI0004950C16|nr:glutamyl-tRNA amidotransferase [Mycoplasmopsis primatum]
MKQTLKEELKEIAQSLMFDINEQVLDEIVKLWKDLNKRIKWLEDIDTTNVEPLSHINEEPKVDFLRDDVENNNLVSISKKDLLDNSKEHNDDYIIINKVIK